MSKKPKIEVEFMSNEQSVESFKRELIKEFGKLLRIYVDGKTEFINYDEAIELINKTN